MFLYTKHVNLLTDKRSNQQSDAPSANSIHVQYLWLISLRCIQKLRSNPIFQMRHVPPKSLHTLRLPNQSYRHSTHGVPRKFFWGGWGYAKNFFEGCGGCSINSIEDRGQRVRRSGGVSPLVRGSTQFPNE
jgi:hypothetical protein